MKRLLIVLLPFTAACGSKNDDPIPTAPTIYTKWHTNSVQNITIQYRAGVVIKDDTLITYGKAADFWEFKENGAYTLYDTQGSRNATFSKTNDSIWIDPGLIYPKRIAFGYKFGAIGGIVGATLELRTVSTEINLPGVDSVRYTFTYKFDR